MRLLTRAFRRAGLPLKFSEGFSPRPKLSIKRALKLGLESSSEEASIILKEGITSDDFLGRMNQQLPEGITIKEIWLEKS